MSFGITAAVVGIGGSIAGSIIQGNETEQAQNKAGNYQDAGLAALESSQKDLLGGAPYLAFQKMLADLGQQPFTYGPGDLESIKARMTDEAQIGARNFQNAAWERAGARGGYRDASTRRGETRLAVELGGRLADANRQVDELGRRTRQEDIVRFGQLLQGLFQLRQGPAQAFSNASIGVGTQQAGYDASGAADSLKGLGTLAVALGSAPRPKNSDGSGGGTLFGSLF